MKISERISSIFSKHLKNAVLFKITKKKITLWCMQLIYYYEITKYFFKRIFNENKNAYGLLEIEKSGGKYDIEYK